MKTPSFRLALTRVAAFAGFCSTVLAQISPPVDSDLVSLEKFEVIGTRPETVDTTALKLPSAVLDTPRSITIFDASRLREQDIQTGGDLLFWVPGLNSNGAVQESYHFAGWSPQASVTPTRRPRRDRRPAS